MKSKDKPPPLCPHLLGALQPLLQLQAQLVGWQPELSAHPLWSRHARPQSHARRPTSESPSRGSKPQTLWPHRGQLWRKLSLWSWCKLGKVGGEFRVHGNWAGSGLLGCEVLGQRVKTATLGRSRQKYKWKQLRAAISFENKKKQQPQNGEFLLMKFWFCCFHLNVICTKSHFWFLRDCLTDWLSPSLSSLYLLQWTKWSQWRPLNRLHSEAKIELDICGKDGRTGVKLGITCKVKTSSVLLESSPAEFLPNPAWVHK